MAGTAECLWRTNVYWVRKFLLAIYWRIFKKNLFPHGTDQRLFKKCNHQKPNREDFTSNDFLTPEVRKSFQLIKKAFLETPILQYFNYNRLAHMETDTSGKAIGGILSQQD